MQNNLKLLKGTEEELGKLDYTKNEREQIKKLVDIAKDKNAQDCSYHWVETHQALTPPNKSFNTITKEINTSIYTRESNGGCDTTVRKIKTEGKPMVLYTYADQFLNKKEAMN